jgi:hypothetical protein
MIKMLQKYMRYGILALSLLILTKTFSLADSTDLLNLEDEQIVEVAAGYRFVDTDNSPNRAAEYSYLNDSPTFNLVIKKYDTNRKFSLVGDYLGHKDFNFAGDLDSKLFRLHLRTERMYHNLDHIPYLPDPAGRENVPAAVIDYNDKNPGVDYGRQITTSEVKLRGKVPNYPAHINLSYWRLEKKGDIQQRFVDEGGCYSTIGCHMQSGTRKLDRVTEEITAGIDAHLGPVDVAFLQTLREFREKGDNPNDFFQQHSPETGTINLFREAGDYDHDTAPDSKMIESTFKINLPPSGGFVTSASYTFGKRENNADYDDLNGDDPETDYQKLVADVTYTPGEKWTVNFRYRMLELDSDGPAFQTSGWSTAGPPGFDLGLFGPEAPVRQSIDIDRNNYAATVSYRPSRRLTLKGDYERIDTDRNQTGISNFNSQVPGGAPNLFWDVPSSETVDRFRLSFFSRHLDKSALKFNGWYQYKHVDDPAYGTTLNASNEFFLNASYRPSAIWGATGSIDILRGENDDRTYTQFDDSAFPGIQVPFDLDRDEERENLAVGLWFIPNSTFSADLNYGMLHSKINQDTLYGAGPSDAANTSDPNDYSFIDDDSDFEQRVHTLSAGANLRILENLNCRVEGYHIRSKSEFTPGSENFVGPNITDPRELRDISEVDIRQNGIKSRITWQFTRMLRAQFEYTYDDYDDQNSDVFDGSAQTFIASLGGSF